MDSNPKIPLQIIKICTPTGSIDGGEEVTLFSNDIQSKNDIKIRISEIDLNHKILWEIIESNIEIHCTAITFVIPKYAGKWPDETIIEIICFIQLIRTSDNSHSNPMEYVYINDDARTYSKAQKTYEKNDDITLTELLEDLPKKQDDHQIKLVADSKNSKILESTQNKKEQFDYQYPIVLENIQNKRNNFLIKIRKICLKYSTNRKLALQQIERLNEEYADNHKYGNSIFHDMLAEGEFPKLYKMSKNLNFAVLIAEVVNGRGENLLHYACKLNKSHLIRSLISCGCSIVAQDINGRTPLHSAIRHQHFECVEKFQELFENHAGFSNVKKGFQRLFEIYDRQGRTVLHLAVLNNLHRLVDSMLSFSKTIDIDVCAIEVLGNGNTILHLAISAKLNDMVNLIILHLPNACKYANYAGYNALGVNINLEKW